jgi:hypothetical protein
LELLDLLIQTNPQQLSPSRLDELRAIYLKKLNGSFKFKGKSCKRTISIDLPKLDYISFVYNSGELSDHRG